METIRIDQEKISRREVEEISGFFRQGKVIALPTDTIYGFSCDSFNAKAIKTIYAIKGREPDKPFLALVSSLSMAKKYASISRAQEGYLKKIWPGPYTVLLMARKAAPKLLVAREGTIAFRLPNNKFLLSIIRSLGRPIVSTSVNLSKQKPINEIGKIKRRFKDIGLIIDGGHLNLRKQSKLIDITDMKKIRAIR
jgi:tRNA threonylcarbamoyl adenosine modification protein (Sua5/YciO/YrdC/YwlC family)